MDFKELLETDEEVKDVETITSLKTSGLPLVLYGASADVADRIVKKLSCYDIDVAAVAFDDDAPLMTAGGGALTFYPEDVQTLGVKDVDKKFPAYNVLPGFVK
ncbi:MAG: hypothetical protein LBC19_07970, partial [Tannerella sp.]|nr:hypothetical protein [Tannerella sp.]